MNLQLLVAGVCAAILSTPLVSAQLPAPPQDAEIVILPTGDKLLCWFAHAGRTYFIETSDPNFPLGVWAWAPIIELGNDGLITHEVGGTADKAFFRLHHTDLPLPAGVSPEDWDTDGDGLSNWSELTIHGTNPLMADTSGDGLPDGWTVAHGLAPLLDNATGLFQDSQSTNLQAYQAGVQADPNATLSNLDGDRADNEKDADPEDPVIDWAPGSHPAFAIIELDIEDVDQVTLDDFSEMGTALFTRTPPGESAVSTRILVDLNQTVHIFAATEPLNPVEGDFSAYGPTLIGDKVPGTLFTSGSNVQSLWDPATDTYTPYQNPASYYDDILDDRDGVTIWKGTGQSGGASGLRKAPGGQLLPGSPALGASEGRIEELGNVVSKTAYWRWDAQTEAYADPATLPVPSRVRSATIVQVQTDGAPDREWNLVAGSEGLMVSSDQDPFQKADTTIGSEAVHGVTRQGWVADTGNDRIWCNGQWYSLKGLLGSPSFEEAELLDILDTGLAVARVKGAAAGSTKKIALLVPVGLEEAVPESGFDNYERYYEDQKIERPWLMVPGDNDRPNACLLHGAGDISMDLAVQNGSITVTPDKTGSSDPLILDLQGTGDDDLAYVTAGDGSRILDLVTYEKGDTIRLAVHAISLTNDDVSVDTIAMNQGEPNQVCIKKKDNTFWSLPQGDDKYSPLGRSIHTGADGICQTPAHPRDELVIRVGQGKENSVIVTAGPNGVINTSPSYGDALQGNTITTGEDGIRNTPAPTALMEPKNVPSATVLEDYLNEVFGKQANIFFEVSGLFEATVDYDVGDPEGGFPDFTQMKTNGRFDVFSREERSPEEEVVKTASHKDDAYFNLYYVPSELVVHAVIGEVYITNTVLGFARGELLCPYIKATGEGVDILLKAAAHEIAHCKFPNAIRGLAHPTDTVFLTGEISRSGFPLMKREEDKLRLMWATAYEADPEDGEIEMNINPKTGMPSVMLLKSECDVLQGRE